MASPPSSSPSSEMSAKPHPYQQDDNVVGPKGAFEARRVNNGLYVRVDMPGVPNGAVKVVKYSDTRTVTFTGKAPHLWPGYDSSCPRVYAGYVVLDRDPSAVKFTSEIDDGVFRLFFPRCDGSLHFLSPPRPHEAALEDETGRNDEEDRIPADCNISFILHSPLDPFGIALRGGKPDHINPHLLNGEKGVYEHKIVPVNDGEHLIYIRLDVPGTCQEANVIMENFDGGIGFGGSSFEDKGSRFGEGIREYLGVLQPACNCCRYNVVRNETRDGVMRFLVRKSDNPKLAPVCHLNLPPATPGGELRPSTIHMFGHLPPTLGRNRIL